MVEEGFGVSPATLREVATLAFRNLGGGVELFFSYNNKLVSEFLFF